MIYLTNPTSGEAIDPTAAAGNTLAANPYLDDQLCWEKYTGMVLVSGTGPCGSNSQAGQLLTTSASFTSTTMPAPGSNGADAIPFKWVRIANKQNSWGSEPIGEYRLTRRTASLLERVARDSDSRRRYMRGANTSAYAGLGGHFVGSHAEIRPESRFQAHGTDGSSV
jgi:hypothetical protein